MRFGLLTQWYDPEPGPAALPATLARGLRDRGHDVQVLTGFPNYPSGAIAPGYRLRPRLNERLDDVAVRRVALYPSHDGSSLRRFVNYASFGVSAATLGLGALRGLDALWVNYSPITVAWPMWAARYGLRVPVVAHVLDLWPDTVLAGGFGRDAGLFGRLSRPLNAWCDAMYRSASAVAYISPSVGPELTRRGVDAGKLHYAPMWADEAIFAISTDDLRGELEIEEDAIVLLYAGALGEAQGLHSLVEACARVTDPRFVAVIAGSGTSESSLRERAATLATTNVRFIGRVPQERMTRLMATADLSFVGLRTHPLSAMTMPSKTQAALAASRALLIAADGDVADVGAASGAALVARPGDPVDIARAITDACAEGRDGLAERGRRGRRYYDATFSVARGVGNIEALLTAAARSHNTRAAAQTAHAMTHAGAAR